MTAVALDLIGTEGDLPHGRQARLHPLLVAALQVDDGLIAELLEGLARQHGAKTGLAVEDDGRGLVGDGAGHPKLQEAPADVGRALDVAVAVLVGVADVDDRQGLPGPEAALEVGRPLLGDDLPRLVNHLPQRLHEPMLPPFLVGC
jgi:hypothetical protein